MRRLVALLLSFVMTLSLTACGTENGENSQADLDAKSVSEEAEAMTQQLPETSKEEEENSTVDLGTNTISEEIKAMALELPEASADHLPNWHGLEYEPMGDYPDGYRNYGFATPGFTEQDVKNVSDLGFNFLRVPLNTKFFFANADVNQPAIQYWENLDELISWGIQYKVHISLVVCETYGHNCTYTEEESTLFQNQQQMDLFVTFWDTVAKRYADIPNNALSFNLLNEPCDYIGEDVYCEMALHLAEVIRAHTPDRLIISDMFSWGKEPLEGLVGSGIVQTIHCYEPNALHSGELEEWPSILPMVNSHIYGGGHFTLRGDFPAGTQAEIYINGVAAGAKILLCTGEKEYELFEESLPEEGKNQCVNVFVDENGNPVYANYDMALHVTLEQDAQTIEIYPSEQEGSVLDLGGVLLRMPDGREVMIESTQLEDADMEQIPVTDLTIEPNGSITDNQPQTDYAPSYDRNWLKTYFQRYADFSEETGTTIFLNEFGVPVTAHYEASLAYMDDLLSVVDEFGWSWCLYDYKGPFGLVKGTNNALIRPDAVYEKMGDCEVDQGLYQVVKAYF